MVLYLTWGISLLSTVISLILSEILKYPPCSLCWYQRIFMYSLAIILPVGIILKDRYLPYYLFVLSGFGFVIAAYHSLIYHNIIAEVLAVCTADLSCKAKQFELFNVLSIPVMSALSFLLLLFIGLNGVLNEKRN